MCRRFAHQRFADSVESIRANRFAKQTPIFEALGQIRANCVFSPFRIEIRVIRVQSSLLSHFWKVDSQNKVFFLKRESIRANRPTKLRGYRQEYCILSASSKILGAPHPPRLGGFWVHRLSYAGLLASTHKSSRATPTCPPTNDAQSKRKRNLTHKWAHECHEWVHTPCAHKSAHKARTFPVLSPSRTPHESSHETVRG